MPDVNPKADVLIVTVTKVESQAVMKVFREATGKDSKPESIGKRIYYDLGEVNGTRIFMALSEMGAGGPGASQQAVQKGITALRPSAVIMVGIAFGVNEQKQFIGDVLVSTQLWLYNLRRIGTDKIIPRGDKPHASTTLIDRFRGADLYWKGAKVRFGLILTGEKLVDNVDYRDQLKQLEPEAIGGEMEGAGLYVACQDAHVDWILVKAICDWADGNKVQDKDERQQLAANNAAQFVLQALKLASTKLQEDSPLSEESSSPSPPPPSSFIFTAPPLPPQGIIGREKDLDRLIELLVLNNADVINVRPVALRGMGGIGKTTLAIALAHQEIIPRMFPNGVLWVALGPDPASRIRSLLNSWGEALGEDLVPLRTTEACRDRLQTILRFRRMLLIVDDVWMATDADYFQVAGPYCRTLYTTRESPIAHDLVTRERTLPVDVLSPKDALALLYRLAPAVVDADKESALRLCERLGFLPLALTLAGQLLANESDVPSRMQRLVDELIERREARLNKLTRDTGRLGLDENKHVSLQAILEMSVKRLSQADQERFAMLAASAKEPLTWEIDEAAGIWDCTAQEAEETISNLIKRGLAEHRGDEYWMNATLADCATVLRRR